MDWQTEQRTFERPRPNLTLQIAVGVAAGILLASLLTWAVLEWRARVAVEQAARALTTMQTELARQLTAGRARQEQHELQRQQEQERQRRERVEVQRVVAEQQRAAIAEAGRKERAWAAFYRKPARCDPPADDALVHCANEYIRAKRDFEAKWAAGKL